MRILAFNWKGPTDPAAGGAEVYLQEVSTRWVAKGHEVTLFCAAQPGQPQRDEIDGVRVVRRGGRIGVYRAARRFYEQEADGKYDVVLDVINTRPFLCPQYVRDVPVVALAYQVAREVWGQEFPWPIAVAGRSWLEPRWLRPYRHVPVLTISNSSQMALQAYGLFDVRKVPVGLTAPRLTRLPPKELVPTVAFLGRLSASKRPQHAIAAFEAARAELSDAQMWVIGSGPLEERLRRVAPEGVHLHGRVSEEVKVDLLARSHGLVATSVREGWGMVVSEAASVGTRSIAYDVPGLCESVAASDGVLVEPTPEALAEALLTYLPRWFAEPWTRPGSHGCEDWGSVAAAIETILLEQLEAGPVRS